MKRLAVPFLSLFLLLSAFSCTSGRFAGYSLNERDAAEAVRQLLQIGAREGSLSGAFSKEMILTTLFPEPIKKALNTLNQFGLTSEIDRFTTTLSTAAEKTAANSVPIFVNGISGMRLSDAVRIIKTGGTSATDYLRSSVGDSLRRSIVPVMQTTIDEYKLTEQWDKIIQPVKGLLGNRVKLDLATLMAGAVSEAMFRKIAEKEVQIRADEKARTSVLLQKVFSRNWK